MEINISTVFGENGDSLEISATDEEIYKVSLNMTGDFKKYKESVYMPRKELVKLYQNLRDFFIPVEVVRLDDETFRVIPVLDEEIEIITDKYKEALRDTDEKYGSVFKKLADE